MIPLLIVLSVAASPLIHRPLSRRISAGAARLLVSLVARLARALTDARKRLAERARLRVAAALLDLGNHLMLCDEERCARRIQGRLRRAAALGSGPEDVLRRFGGSRIDEVTFEAPIGSRAQEGDPVRTLSLSCTVARPPDDLLGAGDRRGDREPVVAWRVTNRPSEGRPGPVSYSEVPYLERALLSYYAPAVSPPAAGGGRFYDEGFHHGEAKPAA